MTLLFLQNWFSMSVARAIGWTLIHSLWQGVLLTMVAGIIFLCARRATAEFRYRILSVLFLVLLAGCCFTFILQLQANSSATETAVLPVNAVPFVDLPVHAVPAEHTPLFFMDRFAGYVNEHASLIVAIWFLFFLVKAIRLIASIGYAQRIKQYNNYQNKNWQKRMMELAGKIGVRQLVSLRESAIVKIPVVIGFLKPVILLPIGLLTNLPADQVEAILLHELAHIKRRDYLINLLQCFAETIFFFNPAVLWLSARIRQEREHCCDDMAIAITGNRSAFVHALIAFHEYKPASSMYATAFPGQKYHLLHRVKRIVSNNNKNLNNMEKIFLTTGLVLTGLLTLAFSSNRLQHKTGSQAETRSAQTICLNKIPITFGKKDTVPEELKNKGYITGTFDKTVNGKNYRIELKNNVIVALYVDNKSIPDEKINDYKEITDKIIEEAREEARKAKIAAERSKELAEKNKEKAEVIRERMERPERKEQIERKEQAERKEQVEQKEQVERKELAEKIELLEAKESDEQAEKQKELSVKGKIMAEKQETLSRKLVAQKQLERNLSMEQQILAEKQARAGKDLERQAILQEKLSSQQNLVELKQQLLEKESIRREKEQTLSAERLVMAEKRALMVEQRKQEAEQARGKANVARQEAEKIQRNVISDLLDEKIIQQSDNLTFELSDESLIVNGVKQPDEVHQRFKNKYGITSGKRMSFNRHSTKQ